MKTIKIQYYAILREQRGLNAETISTTALTAQALYNELKIKHSLTLKTDLLKVAINNTFSDWNTALCDGDEVVFIAPVAGG